jgi:hypothetical protein
MEGEETTEKVVDLKNFVFNFNLASRIYGDSSGK